MIELTNFERSDFQRLISWIDSPEFLFQWGGPVFSFPLTEEQLENYLENANTEGSHKFIYKVEDTNTRAVVGHICLTIDVINNSARVGKVLVGNKNSRGKRIGQRMITEILKVAFDDLNIHRVSLGVFDFNTSAIACYEKAGFQKDGLLRESRKFGQEYWSLWEMSILRSEWIIRNNG